MTSSRALIRGIVVICRDGLDDLPLTHTIADKDLRQHAKILFKQIMANDGEAALLKTVALIQVKLGMSVNAYRCEKVVSPVVLRCPQLVRYPPKLGHIFGALQVTSGANRVTSHRGKGAGLFAV